MGDLPWLLDCTRWVRDRTRPGPRPPPPCRAGLPIGQLNQQAHRTVLAGVLRHDAGQAAKLRHDFGQRVAQLPGHEIIGMAAPAVLRQGLDPQAQDAPLMAGLGAGCAQAFAKKTDRAHAPSLPPQTEESITIAIPDSESSCCQRWGQRTFNVCRSLT